MPVGTSEAKTVIQVLNARRVHPIRFEHEVLPALTKAGCNQGTCHGTPAGKNGFRLSLHGYDPGLDFEVLARERSPAHQPVPARGQLDPFEGDRPDAHEGGQRIGIGSVSYRLLLDWVAEGVRPDPRARPRPRRAGCDAPGSHPG